MQQSKGFVASRRLLTELGVATGTHLLEEEGVFTSCDDIDIDILADDLHCLQDILRDWTDNDAIFIFIHLLYNGEVILYLLILFGG